MNDSTVNYTIHPGSAALAVSTVSSPIAFASNAIPLLQAISLLVSIISGMVAIYFYIKKK
jgi:xanthine/uracil permease